MIHMRGPTRIADRIGMIHLLWLVPKDRYNKFRTSLMSSAYGKIDRPKDYNATELDRLIPIETTTKYNKLVSVHSLTSLLREQNINESKLISYLQHLLNNEIKLGNTYPQKNILNLSEFVNYFLSGDVFIVVNSGKIRFNELENSLEENVLGTFYIKPNFPGRCSHICNGGFITAPGHRNQGIGKIMALAFIQFAPLLGYKASMFNLVFVNNTPSVRLWKSLGFKEIGRIPNAGRLLIRNEEMEGTTTEQREEFVDAIMYYYSFI
ncbi:unnamed protein product [Didymodactylos carnosus]|uniref:N-acetyltransferase domain-containing protein n=1 Tax=Didymodactylos carnosus TaxID=1234261 RepID=A0A815R913_9BILA|nr:unnamed protein product [Didymodactylos carnosus]CAF1473636.1 unnamed protein product [Didymodactylos carnosus]CAF4215612.1 unnamed protein product [Didymodactylos carnosus]CAF4340468.1 unnamed protein product [Didymodactylos carnosus]